MLRTFTIFFLLLLLPAMVVAQNPTANFSADIPDPPCAPLNVIFNNLSSSATSYSWTLDGVLFSTEVNPEKIFTVEGAYLVCVEATNSNGSDTHCETIEIYTGSDFDFVATTTPVGCPPLEISFDVLSDNNDIVSVVWDFGDGELLTTSSLSATHTYESSSVYDVSVTTINSNGCETFVTHENLVDVLSEVVPQFTVGNTVSCQAPLTVDFTNTSSGNLNGVIYAWDFGDGGTSNDENPSHTYNTTGSFDVSLTIVNDNSGCRDLVIMEDLVNIGEDPTFSFVTETGGACNQVTANFTNETENGVIYFWDFGDGGTSNLENPTHIYTAAGCHYPTLTVTTTAGCVVSYQSTECVDVTGAINLYYTTTGETTACEAPLTVSFDPSYSGNVEWDFGGAGTSTAQNPTFTFTEEGIYPVTLTALLPNGCEQTVISTTIEIAPPPAYFEADILEGCAPLSVNFTDLTDIPETIVSWEWDFGDGSTSSTQNPSHTFVEPGEYNVSLTITLDDGCVGTAVWTNYIQTGYIPPVNFEADPTETCIENIIGFTDLSEDDNIDSWYWDFGDGSFSPDPAPLHEYNDTGWFDVKLVVGYNSCYDSLIIEDYMHLFPPKAIFYHNQDCSNPGAVSFTDNSIGADTWSWDFGDGNSSSEPNPTHFYTENGVYTVTLEVYNEESGCTDDMSIGIYVQVPVASFEVNPMVGCYNGSSVSLQVNNTSENAVEYDWYAQGIFVVMNSMNDPNPIFRFNGPGEYTGMQLTITDAAGCQDVFVFEDTIVITEINADFTFENIDSDCNQIFQFTDASASFFADIETWEWDFGDGQTSNEQNPTHTYGQGGYYITTLTVTNTAGCSNTISYANPLQVELPFVSFNTDTIICREEQSIFTNVSVASEFVDWSWDFGNGDTSSDWSPEYTYGESGTYLACFSATNSDGCIGSLCRNIVVEEITADFTADVTSSTCNPLVVQFEDLSTNIIDWVWDFGDNSGTSVLQNPAHTYTNSGYFTVCVTMTSISGCTETICKDNFIEVGGPTAEVTYSPGADGCLDYEVIFEIDGNEEADNFVLDFGDGATESGVLTTNALNLTHTYTALGSFAPILLLENAEGCQNFMILDSIRTANLAIAATSSDNNFCAGTTIDFDSEITTSGIIQNIEWSLEGASPNTSNEANPTGITYANEGYYDVTLTVTTDVCSKTIVLEDYIHVLPQPNLSFTASPATNCGPTTVVFQNTSNISSGNISSWSWDLGNGTTSTLESPSASYDSIGVYSIQLTAESDQGCVSEMTGTVTILEEAFAEILVEDYILCQGQTIQLESEVNGQASWSPAGGLSCTNCPNPTANPPITTTYYLTTTTSSGCIATDSITIERLSITPPVVTITEDMSICQEEVVQIIATGGTAPYHYSWDENAEGLSCYQNCSNPIVEIEETTTFTVFVSNDEGCITSESVEIEVIGSDLDLLGPDKIICQGESVQLNGSEGANPMWANHPSLSCLDCLNPVANPLFTTTYTLSVDYQGCRVSKDITVEVLSQESINAGADALVCVGETITLNGDAPGDIVWESNGVVIGSGSLDIEVNPIIATDYILIATNDLCVLTDTVRIEVRNKLELETTDIEICEVGAVQLNASGEGITNYEWTPSANLTLANTANPTAIVNGNASFTVIGSNGMCEGDTATVQVTIIDAPNLILPQEQSYVPGMSVTLMPDLAGDETCTYNWSPNINISCIDCPNPVVMPDSMTTYTLVVTNSAGCSTEDMITLRPIEDCLEEIVVIPTGFSPNNDGHNDVFRTLGLAEINLFRVFNRWGEMVFETSDSSDGWDGTYKGKELNTDVYIWYLEAVCPLDGTIVSRKGDVTLIR